MALKDLVVRGPKPKPKRKREVVLDPIHTGDDNTWMYPEKKHLLVVHEVRDERGGYIRTEQIPIKWVHIKTALKIHTKSTDD